MADTIKQRNDNSCWQFYISGVASCPACEREYVNEYGGDIVCDQCCKDKSLMIKGNQRAGAAMVSQFLSTLNRDPYGSWPEIEWTDIHALHDVVMVLTSLKYGADVDNDLPIKCQILPRKTHYVPWDIPMTHADREADPIRHREVLMRNIDLAAGAIKSYAGLLDNMMYQLRCLDQEQAGKK